MRTQTLVLNADRNVTLTYYVQPVGGEYSGLTARPAVVILPGGGYSMCSDREAEPVAFPFLAAGYQVFVLRYSVGQHAAWPHPLDDFEQAMALIDKHAEAWHVLPDKIAAVGFSAGGHLAACAATIGRRRPAAAILGYPAILPPIVDACRPGLPYPAEHVDDNTPPCFLFSTRDDAITPVENTLAFADVLTAHGISYECHVYAFGPHGFSTGADWLNDAILASRAPRWTSDAIAWLGDVLGTLTPTGMTKPVCPPTVNDDRAELLSVDCTLGHLLGQPAAVQGSLEALRSRIRTAAAAQAVSESGFTSAVKGMRLRDLLAALQHTGDEIEALDLHLRRFSNT